MYFIELFKFLTKPHLFNHEQLQPKEKWKELLVLFGVTYLLKTIYLFTISKYIRENFDVDKSEIVQNNQPLLVFFLLAVLAYPVLEEFIFRYWLDRKLIITFVIILALTLTISNWLLTTIHYESNFVRSIVLLSNSVGVISIFTFGYYRLRKSNKLENYFIHSLPVFYYLSVVSFGAVHILNFDLAAAGIWSILLSGPFIFSGITLGYVRLKYGMIYGIGMHMAFNLTTFVLDKGFGI